MKSILDKSFRYVPSGQTDIAATFRKVRKAMKEESERATLEHAKVTPLPRKEKSK